MARPVDGSESKINSLDPLDDCHTYIYYLFLKYGLVDEVLIYSSRHLLDKSENILSSYQTPYGSMRIIYGTDYEEALNSDGIVWIMTYGFDENLLEKFKDKIIVYKSIESGFPKSELLSWIPIWLPYVCQYRAPNHRFIDLILAEGAYNQKFIPRNIKSLVWPSLARIRDVESTNGRVFKYDWICVSSVQPRKRIFKFVKMLSNNARLRGTQGCLVLNKVNQNQSCRKEFDRIQKHILACNLKVQVKLQTSHEERACLLRHSKVFVCTGSKDSGPRVASDAASVGCVILALKHHGGPSSLVVEGKNGVLTWFFCLFPFYLERMLQRFDRFDAGSISGRLHDDFWFAPIAAFLKQLIEKRKNK